VRGGEEAGGGEEVAGDWRGGRADGGAGGGAEEEVAVEGVEASPRGGERGGRHGDRDRARSRRLGKEGCWFRLDSRAAWTRQTDLAFPCLFRPFLHLSCLCFEFQWILHLLWDVLQRIS
jgi:hypothetical protein